MTDFMVGHKAKNFKIFREKRARLYASLSRKWFTLKMQIDWRDLLPVKMKHKIASTYFNNCFRNIPTRHDDPKTQLYYSDLNSYNLHAN